MSLSVSSERAFSQGGAMISKHRSCLKGDITEALQCVKCVIQHDLLFQEPSPSSTLELEEHDEELVDVAGGSLGTLRKSQLLTSFLGMSY
jgi:hAT family C-terminal dimerisation region